MLAYVFWHYPYDEVAVDRYEQALVAFYADLDRAPPPDYRGCATYRTRIPWFGDRAGYEDWCLVESSAALETLNAAAVNPARWDVHAAVASRMDTGAGGLYYHIGGEADPRAGERVIWLRRPRGIRYQDFLERMTAGAEGFIGAWRKLMVLGPGDEFALVGTRALKIELPAQWQARVVERERLC
jgi:hypothetical protein